MENDYSLQKVADFNNDVSNQEEVGHPLAVVGDYLFVVDGKALYKMYVPPKTIWQRIKDVTFPSKF